MERGEFLKTQRGQRSRRLSRRSDRLYFQFDLVPKSKKAITETEKAYFQNVILETLVREKRRYFTGPVAVQFDFWVDAKLTPAIEQLPKNYLDLMIHTNFCNTRRKHLLIEDDRLVEVLTVNLWQAIAPTKPKIIMKIDSMRNFKADLALSAMIFRNDFKDKRWDYRRHSELKKIVGENEEDEYEWNISLRDVVRQKNEASNLEERERAELLEKLIKRDLQKSLLKNNILNPRMLADTYENYKAHPDYVQEYIKRGREEARRFLTHPVISVDLKKLPAKEGDSAAFRSTLSNELGEFKSRYAAVFPVEAPLGATILLVPPPKSKKNNGRKFDINSGVDLDNLARKILPAISSIIEPPASHKPLRDIEELPDEPWYEIAKAQRNALKRMPKNSLVRYQVITLPRYDGDPPEGKVNLYIDDAESGSSVWADMERAIDVWERQH